MTKQKARWISFGCLLALLVVVGIGGFLLGKKAEAGNYQKEKELNILLNRSDLEGLGEIEGTIYVTGHRSPDSDTVGSSIAYASLLQALGYDAVPIVLGKINRETAFILDAAGLETPELMEEVSGQNMILVDHSEYTQSAEGLRDANIISIIDHHGDGAVTTGNQLIYDARPLGSTATIIWIRYRNYGVELDKKTALVMIGSILSDTANLQSNNTTSADREAVKALNAIAGISDTDAFYQEMYKASLSYDGMTDGEIFLSDYKEYESGGTKYGIGCINAYDDDDAREIAGRMKNIVTDSLAATGMDMAFAQISIFHDDLSITYLVPSNEAAAEVIRTAFGDDAVFDGTSFRIEPGISRRQVLVPAITDVLESYPKE
jgi:manganese-dependent inorganic pyrophosphatase